MKVFISWSGSKSKRIAEVFNEFIPIFLQTTKPYMSKSMDKGTIWLLDILRSLEESYVGIVCLTKDNQNKPWINFEAGALLQGTDSSRIMTFLIDLTSDEVIKPLSIFQSTSFTEEEILSMILSINKKSEMVVQESVISTGFSSTWKLFKKKIEKIISEYKEVGFEDTEKEIPDERKTEELIRVDNQKELLFLARDSNNILKSLKTDFSSLSKQSINISKKTKENQDLQAKLMPLLLEKALESRESFDRMMELAEYGKKSKLKIKEENPDDVEDD
ncbi:hypothetical protein [Candidatus Lokiarchaeum ossiferum]|uniref:hypothetical protein n=1 Tax=Candidatus Lokiarchaeum ossiferum TaxID=2951803 RepID=UPI00352DBDBE